MTPLDLAVLRRLLDRVRDQLPVLHQAPVRVHRGGIPTMTPDGQHIVGPVPGADGLFVASGCNVAGPEWRDERRLREAAAWEYWHFYSYQTREG